MKKLFSFIFFCTLGFSLTAQDLPAGGPPPPAGGQQMQQTPDVFIPLDTKNTSLVFRVNGRDGKIIPVLLRTEA